MKCQAEIALETAKNTALERGFAPEYDCTETNLDAAAVIELRKMLRIDETTSSFTFGDGSFLSFGHDLDVYVYEP